MILIVVALLVMLAVACLFAYLACYGGTPELFAKEPGAGLRIEVPTAIGFGLLGVYGRVALPHSLEPHSIRAVAHVTAIVCSAIAAGAVVYMLIEAAQRLGERRRRPDEP